MKIEEMPIFERPYERLEKYGAEVLSDAELLGVILKTGTKEESAVEVARKILLNNEYKEQGLRFLNTISINELMKFKGVGKVKAITLKAIGEIVKRVERPITKQIEISSTSDAAKVLMPELRYEKTENFCVLYLDIKNKLDKVKKYTDYRENSVNISIKSILEDAVRADSKKIIIAHNHPSGDPTPSKSDISFTRELIEITKILEISLIDHIIIGDGVYVSVMNYI